MKEKLFLARKKTPIFFDPKVVAPQWFHPLLNWKLDNPHKLSTADLEAFAYDYFLRFLPFFRDQPEGTLAPGVTIQFSNRMRYRLGEAALFSHSIKLNAPYFRTDPRLLPYSLFHELVHLWLYSCHLDPGHTRRFYAKMRDFEQTRLPVDPDVHIHQRLAKEAKFIYYCAQCNHRWFVNVPHRGALCCGYCIEKFGVKVFPTLQLNTKTVIANY